MAKKILPKTLNPEETRLLLLCPDVATPRGLRDRAIFEVFHASGIRVSELTDLKLKNILWGVRQILVLGKGGKERLVPMMSSSLDWLKKYIDTARGQFAKEDNPYVFLTRRGDKFTRQGIWYMIGEYAERAGIKHVFPHMMRHTTATKLYASGMDIRTVQKQLGHVRLETTQIYTHVDISHQQKEYDRVMTPGV